MPLPELRRLLEHGSTLLFVLRLEAQPVGMCEFVGAHGSDIELANFGLVPAAQGKGLGGHLLNVALRAAWSPSTTRIWLRTDTNDHPRAVPTYERAGFQVYARTVEEFPD
jgi:GNAT superfamily N-acetyltransferase